MEMVDANTLRQCEVSLKVRWRAAICCLLGELANYRQTDGRGYCYDTWYRQKR